MILRAGGRFKIVCEGIVLTEVYPTPFGVGLMFVAMYGFKPELPLWVWAGIGLHRFGRGLGWRVDATFVRCVNVSSTHDCHRGLGQAFACTGFDAVHGGRVDLGVKRD